MSKPDTRRDDPAATLRELRGKILSGANPVLDSLSPEEMAAANDMISRGEAEISYHSCRQFLSAKRHDDLSGLAELLSATQRFWPFRRD